ncbi:ribonuclease H-like domain-containing protein [Umbelopsis sp. PMI_123]|nr:ribonuclease H-like domain-containing protein [Umbelopsis sp. PMI_123]
MEVLRSTFLEKLPEIKSAIDNAAYIAIDTELTGLSRPINSYRATDDVATRYEKVSQSSREFSIIQFGLACFHWDADKRAFVAKPFNFYIFPNGEPREAGERFFTCSSSSLTFLKECNFDFNKLIKEGIGYLTDEEAEMYLERVNITRTKEDIAIDDQNRSFFEATREAIDDWLQTQSSKTLNIEAANSYLRRLVYQIISEGKYNGFLAAKSLDKRQMQIRKLTEETRNMNQTTLPDINFCKVIEYIKNANCPLIGHNCFLDICQIISQFCQRLPDDVQEWKSLVQKSFKRVIDTKHLSNHPKIKEFLPSTALGPLYENMSRDPFKSHGPKIILHKDFNRYNLDDNSDDIAHEAGFDALMTGVVYLRMAYYILRNEVLDTMESDTITSTAVDTAGLGSESSPSSSSVSDMEEGEYDGAQTIDGIGEDGDPSQLLNTCTSITDFYDKMHLMRCELYFVDLKGESEGKMTNRDLRKNVFYLHNIPTGMSTYGLELLYGDLCPVSIHWKTNSSAWLTVKHENRVELAKPGLLGMDVIKPFVEDDTKFSIASNNGITPEAANIEMLTSQEYHDLHRAHNVRNGNITPVHQTVVTPEISSPVASGGTSYDGKGYCQSEDWLSGILISDCQTFYLLLCLLHFYPIQISISKYLLRYNKARKRWHLRSKFRLNEVTLIWIPQYHLMHI